jgi:hypothetical protein
MKNQFRYGWTLCAFALLTTVSPRAASSGKPTTPAPLFDGLGKHHHPVTTTSTLAQRYFDQGLILLYGFNHPEAIRSFRAAAQVDSDCAMAWWGVAYGLGPNINAAMEDSAVPQAWDALQRALAKREHASPAERAYIDALAKRYTPKPVADRSSLDLAYANAMREVTKAYPDDLDAAVLFVEALMDTTPWDYWNEDKTAKAETREFLAVLERVIRRDPDHSGAHHFYIHAVESGPQPAWGIPSADRLRDLTHSAR